jgi:hypothetical protein
MTAKKTPVVIYHLKTRLFMPFDEDRSVIEEVYAYRTDRTSLGEVFRDNNAVDGDEAFLQYNKRSLSVGDVVRIGDEWWAVEPVGWKSLTEQTVIQALEREWTPFDGL